MVGIFSHEKKCPKCFPKNPEFIERIPNEQNTKNSFKILRVRENKRGAKWI